MKKILWTLVLSGVTATAIYLVAADHIDAPAVGSLSTGSTAADITDYYAFESPSNADNYVFVCNVLGLTAPAATASAAFEEDVMYEFNIDNDGDNVEDFVIQAVFKDGRVMVYGPVAPLMTGLESKIARNGNSVEANITAYGSNPEMGESGGIKIFAGPRDDPFFMDFFRFVNIVNGVGASLGDNTNTGLYDPNRTDENGDPYPASFNNPGMDTFAGANVLSVVVEVPKSMLGSSATFSSWVESKRKN